MKRLAWYRCLPVWGWLVAAGVWGSLLVKGLRKLHKAVLNGDRRNDFEVYYEAARQILAGETPLSPESPYMNPPLLACLLVPLALLPAYAAGVIWLLAKVPAFYYSAWQFVRGIESTWVRQWALSLAPVLVYRFLDSDLSTGNSNVYLLALAAWFTQLALPGQGRRSALWAGTVLAVFVSIKLTPAYLMLVAGVRRRWLLLVSAVVLLPLFLLGPALLLPGGVRANSSAFLGTSSAVFDVSASAALEREMEDRRPGAGYLPGQSLRAIVHRYLRPIDATSHDELYVAVNFGSLSPEQAEWLYRSIALVLALAALTLLARGSLVRPDDWRWAIATALVVMLLVSPYSRKAHFLLLLPSTLLVLTQVLVASAGGAVRRWGALSLGLCFAFGQLSTSTVMGRANSNWVLGWGIVGWAGVAILVGMWIIRPQRHEQAK